MEAVRPIKQFIFIDESGDLGMHGSKYLVLVALIVNDYTFLNRTIKNMRRNKFKHKLGGVQEIKANSSTPEIIKFMLFKLSQDQKAKAVFIIADVIAWSCFQQYEHQNPKYLDILKIKQETYFVW